MLFYVRSLHVYMYWPTREGAFRRSNSLGLCKLYSVRQRFALAVYRRLKSSSMLLKDDR